jgi:hypothetical protein
MTNVRCMMPDAYRSLSYLFSGLGATFKYPKCLIGQGPVANQERRFFHNLKFQPRGLDTSGPI